MRKTPAKLCLNRQSETRVRQIGGGGHRTARGRNQPEIPVGKVFA
jgi:hypothetical protein